MKCVFNELRNIRNGSPELHEIKPIMLRSQTLFHICNEVTDAPYAADIVRVNLRNIRIPYAFQSQ